MNVSNGAVYKNTLTKSNSSDTVQPICTNFSKVNLSFGFISLFFCKFSMIQILYQKIYIFVKA